MEEHLKVQLSASDVHAVYEASPLDPLFPMNFLFNFRGDQPYHLGLTSKDNQQYQMAARINAPPKQAPY